MADYTSSEEIDDWMRTAHCTHSFTRVWAIASCFICTEAVAMKNYSHNSHRTIKMRRANGFSLMFYMFSAQKKKYSVPFGKNRCLIE